MKYKDTHPRKVRGAAVHQTIGEKKKETPAKTKAKQKDKEKKNRSVPSIGVSERQAIEEAYLAPEIDHFVEAHDVKNVEKRVKLWLNTGYPVHLIGPTGCGKTSLAMHVANEMGRPVVWINGDESITTTDLIGGYSQIEQESIRDKYVHNVFKSKDILKADWVDNPLALACKYGYTLVYNEFSRTKPTANNILLSVFEERILELPTKFGEERYIKVHPDFKAILTSNSVEYAGVHRPQDALLDRLVSIYMDYYSFDTEVNIVNAHTGLPKDDARKIVGVVRSLREKLSDAQKPGTRACIMIGQGLRALNGQGNMNFEQLCIDVMATKTRSPMDLIEKQALVKDAIAALA
ncbi:MAG: gas vesicle protein GvpN [Candidatus Methanoperedens sp.]|nr:gas vesicle protein GvpN [Candidatus Methanoperedens sp.]